MTALCHCSSLQALRNLKTGLRWISSEVRFVISCAFDRWEWIPSAVYYLRVRHIFHGCIWEGTDDLVTTRSCLHFGVCLYLMRHCCCLLCWSSTGPLSLCFVSSSILFQLPAQCCIHVLLCAALSWLSRRHGCWTCPKSSSQLSYIFQTVTWKLVSPKVWTTVVCLYCLVCCCCKDFCYGTISKSSNVMMMSLLPVGSPGTRLRLFYAS